MQTTGKLAKYYMLRAIDHQDDDYDVRSLPVRRTDLGALDAHIYWHALFLLAYLMLGTRP